MYLWHELYRDNSMDENDPRVILGLDSSFHQWSVCHPESKYNYFPIDPKPCWAIQCNSSFRQRHWHSSYSRDRSMLEDTCYSDRKPRRKELENHPCTIANCDSRWSFQFVDRIQVEVCTHLEHVLCWEIRWKWNWTSSLSSVTSPSERREMVQHGSKWNRRWEEQVTRKYRSWSTAMKWWSKMQLVDICSAALIQVRSYQSMDRVKNIELCNVRHRNSFQFIFNRKKKKFRPWKGATNIHLSSLVKNSFFIEKIENKENIVGWDSVFGVSNGQRKETSLTYSSED